MEMQTLDVRTAEGHTLKVGVCAAECTGPSILVVPGLVLTGLFVTYVALWVAFNRSKVPRERSIVNVADAVRSILICLPVGGLILLIFFSMYLGFATPTEAAALGCALDVVPARTPLEAVLERKPHGIFLSNGPGDPEAVDYLVGTVRGLIGKVPIFGICLGNQILGLAAGGRTYKLKFGHHGANHPVKDLSTGRVEITSQNHGFAVDPRSVAAAGFAESHVSLNDGTSEGMRHRELPMFSVQYHPEASPGPHDADYLFDRFVTLMEGGPVPCPST